MGNEGIQYAYIVVAAVISFAIGKFLNFKSKIHEDHDYSHGKADAEAEAKARIMEAEARGFMSGKQEGYSQGLKESEALLTGKMAEEFSRGIQKGKEDVLAEYEVRVFPFSRSDKVGIGPWSSFDVEIGYTHQLYVRNMPCMEPSEIILKKSSEKELDVDKLIDLAGKVVREAIASSSPAGIALKVASTVPHINK